MQQAYQERKEIFPLKQVLSRAKAKDGDGGCFSHCQRGQTTEFSRQTQSLRQRHGENREWKERQISRNTEETSNQRDRCTKER